MKAITCRYLGPGNVRGSRIKADDGDGNSVTISYPHELRMGEEAHAAAAIALCQKMGWHGPLIGGATKDAWVFCFERGDRHEVPLTQADIDRRSARIDAIMVSNLRGD